MASIFNRKRNLRVPITLSVLLIGLNVFLMVCWIVILAQLYWWGALAWGTVIFTLMLIGMVVYLVLTIKEVRLNQRQTNFVDSVTHELKSPIASMKLYLETLQIRPLSDAQRQEFFRSMVEDLDRLDQLITQLLEVGRLDAIVSEGAVEEVPAEPLLRLCAVRACAHNNQPVETVTLSVEPAVLLGPTVAYDMIFRNLLDNAVKYAGDAPVVEVDLRVVGKNRVVARVADNGKGVPPELRNKIFQLFFRGGSELERTRTGTGLGLYIVHTLVKKLKGKVSVHARSKLPGAVFEVELPGRAVPCVAS